jgi:hypothetical protein
MARPRIGLALGSGSVRLLHHTGHCPGRLRLRLQGVAAGVQHKIVGGIWCLAT